MENKLEVGKRQNEKSSWKVLVKVIGERLPVQDDRVEGNALISSCESTKITTSCWIIFVRRTLESIKKKKKIPHIQKQRSHSKQVGGGQSWQNQIPYPSGGWPTNWRTITPKKFSCCEGSEPHVRLPSLEDLTKELGIPRESDLEGQQDLIKRFPQDWEKQRPQSWGAQTKPCIPQDAGKEQWLHRSLKQNYQPVLEGPCGGVVWQGPTTGTGALEAALFHSKTN